MDLVDVLPAGFTVVPDIRLRSVADERLAILQWLSRGIADEFISDKWPEDRRTMTEVWPGTIARAALWYVADDMCGIVDAAAQSMPGHALHQDDPPDLSGLVFFARPLTGIDSVHRDRGESDATLAINAMSWCPFTRGDLEHNVGVLFIVSWVCMGGPGGRTVWVPIGQALWALGQSSTECNDLNNDDLDSQHAMASTIEDRQRIAALWALAAQEAPARVDDVKPDRSSKRRSERAGHPVDTLRVMRLRRPHRDSTAEHADGVEWTHRWMVSGHWRNHWMPSQQRHRLMFIAPYVKGPDDKPLVLKDTVKALVR